MLSVLLVLLFSLTIKLRRCKHVVFITVKLEVFFSCHDKKFYSFESIVSSLETVHPYLAG